MHIGPLAGQVMDMGFFALVTQYHNALYSFNQ
jgi:hypothetical protein